MRSFLTWLKESGRIEAGFDDSRLLWRSIEGSAVQYNMEKEGLAGPSFCYMLLKFPHLSV